MIRAAIPRQRFLTVLAASAGAAIILTLVAGCTFGAPTSAPVSPTATPSVTATVAATGTFPPASGALGPPPSNCHTSPPPHTMTVSNFGGGFIGTTTFAGASPAWEQGFDTVITMSGTPYPSTKVMWVVGPNYAQPVTLRGHELSTGTPLWFDVYPNNMTGGRDVYGTSATLDPNAPNRGFTDNSSGRWNIWGIGIIASAAGCYEFDVASAGGSWHAVVAVGSGS